MMHRKTIMKSPIINLKFIVIFFFAFLFFVIKQESAYAAHGMSPRDGHVTTQTGAPVPFIKITEFTDTCPPAEYWTHLAPGCPYPYSPGQSCHAERSVWTDANGYYYFSPDWPINQGNICDPNVAWRYTCSNPVVMIGAVADNPQASTNSFIPKVYAQASCTPVQHPTSNITDAITTDLICNPPPQKPPACGAQCFRNEECAGAKDGCTECQGVVFGPPSSGQPPGSGVTTTTPGTCQPPPSACGTACTKDTECAGSKDGCTICRNNSCQSPPACGMACTKDTECAGAKNGCTNCTGGKCTAFREDMCKCDGMDFQLSGGATTFFPGDKVTFVAFGKVEGNDINIADLQSMTFSLYQSKLSDPNTATRIAQSTAITPTIIETTGSKVRYKVTWDRQIPATVPSGTLFRIQATIKCVAKPGVLGAKTQALGETNYFSKLYDTVSGMFARGSVLADSVTPTPSTADTNQHAKTFSPGAKIQETSCTFIKFFFE
jgi:hypothetical protein